MDILVIHSLYIPYIFPSYVPYIFPLCVSQFIESREDKSLSQNQVYIFSDFTPFIFLISNFINSHQNQYFLNKIVSFGPIWAPTRTGPQPGPGLNPDWAPTRILSESIQL